MNRPKCHPLQWVKHHVWSASNSSYLIPTRSLNSCSTKGQSGSEDSQKVRTPAALIGDNSPLMKILDPEEADGLVATLRESVDEALRGEREKILSQFSLDDKQSAISRLVVELPGHNSNLQ